MPICVRGVLSNLVQDTMTNFYYPKSKREMIDLLVLRFPQDKNRFKKMSVKQLKAIRKSIITKHLNYPKKVVI